MPLEHVKEGYNDVQRCAVLVFRAPNNCFRRLKGIGQQRARLRPSAESAVPRAKPRCRNMATGLENKAERSALA
jgi:hypothetical protein